MAFSAAPFCHYIRWKVDSCWPFVVLGLFIKSDDNQAALDRSRSMVSAILGLEIFLILSSASRLLGESLQTTRIRMSDRHETGKLLRK